MIYPYIGLSCIIVLAIPITGFLDKIEVIAERKLFESAPFHFIGIEYDNLCPNRIAVSEAFRNNGADLIFRNVVLVNQTGVMSYYDRLGFVRCKAFWIEDIFREPQLSSDASIRIGVLKDSGGSENRFVFEVTFFGVLGFGNANTIKAGDLRELWGSSLIHEHPSFDIQKGSPSTPFLA